MYNISLRSKTLLFTLLLIATFALFSQSAKAASNDPACSLYTLHNGEISSTQSEVTIKVKKNDIVGLLWNGVNTSAAVDSDGNPLALLGFKILTPTKDATYAYTFSQGSKKVTCSVNLELISGNLSIKEKIKSGERITLSGRVEGVEKVVVTVYEAGSATAVYTTKSLAVKNNKFSFKMPKALPDNNYTVSVMTTGASSIVLATSTVAVGVVVSKTDTTLVVQTVPLLTGGTVKLGRGVATMYVQVINIGSNPANLTGFTFSEIGSAPAASMVGVTITDELGLSTGSVGNMVSDSPFVGSTVSVPLLASLAPRESRLFTVRAVIAPVGVNYIGTQLTMALTGITSNGRIQSALPLSGVTWTITQ